MSRRNGTIVFFIMSFSILGWIVSATSNANAGHINFTDQLCSDYHERYGVSQSEKKAFWKQVYAGCIQSHSADDCEKFADDAVERLERKWSDEHDDKRD